jgi:hypothetical protein
MALTLALVAQAAVLAVPLYRNGGVVRAVRTVTEATSISNTNIMAFVDMPGMSTTVNVPSGEKAILVVTFSAETHCVDPAPPFSFCELRVNVDGLEASPGGVQFDTAADGTSAETNSMQWVAGPLGPGPHPVQVQWFLRGTDGAFTLEERTLTVLRSRL